ncbi:MAG: tetratricopeptide repeat protein [Verrucomicrobia bacterium]|nr:tetratricopeptide repeat protein [Verrucomicrobiota bacterium]
MSQEKPKASFVTFYSFKGGVGRSMALINTAGILAGRGFRVLVIDLDLEAPGLSYLDPRAPDTSREKQKPRRRPLKRGFVDLLSDAKKRGKDADLFALSAADIAKRYTQAYHLPEALREFKDGSLSIMPAGKFDGGYAQRFDSLNLHELYQQGLGEPLVRAFKKKLTEADLYDYVLVDSRTGFSDEAGICTRDLADHLMILSGLNRQNVEGTCAFLKALRGAKEGKKTKFQIILSPVPNGEDKLVDDREKEAKSSFEEAWGSGVDLSLQIPYHPQLALTEEPHIFRRRRGYLFEAYRAIEDSMLGALGHDARTLMRRIEETLQQKDYPTVLRDLWRLVRLKRGRTSLSQLASNLGADNQRVQGGKAESELNQERITLAKILADKEGRRMVEFIVDHLPLNEMDWARRELLDRLASSAIDLADRLYKRIVEAASGDADTLGNYALFLRYKRGDTDGAEVYFKRATKADPKSPRHLGNYAFFLETRRGDMDGAEAYYKRAIEADPKHANNLVNYANFLEKRRHDADGAEAQYKRAIEADPKSVRPLNTYALFLKNRRGDKDGAEACYKRAIKADPKNAYSLGMYANFLWQQRADKDSAEKYFQQALEVAPKDSNTLCNYGQFLVGLARFSDGEKALLSAFENLDQFDPDDMAEICFSLWLASLLQRRDGERWERGFKFFIEQDFERYPWSFDQMLGRAEKTLSAEEFEYAKALAAAFLDKTKVADLQRYERWRTLDALDPKRKEAVEKVVS